jgi:hypothetical protein
MNKALRRVTYLSFFVLFFILTPLFIMYAVGYRYNFDINTIEKNGAFYIKSYPRGAEIYIDNIKTRHKTPHQLTNIQPGNHDVLIQKDGYLDWHKQLSVYSGETTFAEDIVLFLTDIQKTSFGRGSDNFLVNKQKNKYAYIDDYDLLDNNMLMITDIEQAKTQTISGIPLDHDLIDWSDDNQYLLLKYLDSYSVFNINQKKLINLEITNPDKIIWDDKESNILWFLKNNKLYKHNIQNPDNPILVQINNPIADFDLYNDYLVLQYNLDNNYFIQQLDKNNLDNVQTIENLNLGKLKILRASDKQIIFILGSKLFIKQDFKDIISIPVTDAELYGNRILLSNGHEIIQYNYEQDWQELIDRSSQIVSDIVWHPNGSYFLNEINEITNITELDGRDKRNSLEILNNPLKKLYLFNSEGDQLFILTPEENFYLTIQ